MRTMILFGVVAAAALAGCDQEESYAVGADDAFGKLVSASMSEGIYPLPSGLTSALVKLDFHQDPDQHTAYWAFNKEGREIARISAAVEGDASKSTISYHYVEGPAASEFGPIEGQVEQHMTALVPEVVDAGIENRPASETMIRTANTGTAMALNGEVQKSVSTLMEESTRKAEDKAHQAQGPVASSNGEPGVDLSKF